MNLDQITAQFDRAYTSNSKAKENLAKRQKAMFEAFTKELADGPLAQSTTFCPHWKNMTGKEQDAWLAKHHPGWQFIGYEYPEVIIQEDPAYLKFTHINRTNGKVYGRTFAEGSPGLDDDELKADNPGLWERITVWPEPWYSLVKELVASRFSMPVRPSVIEDHVSSVLTKYKIERVLRDFKELSDDDLLDLQDYMIPGPKTIRLVLPRDAKPEELEEHAEEEDEF